MTSPYPAQIDDSITLPTAADNSTGVNGAVVNRLRDAILAIESALGINPASVYGTVRERLVVIEAALNNAILSVNGDLGGSAISQKVIGLQGRPISNDTPSDGYVLAWDGTEWEPQSIPMISGVTPSGTGLRKVVSGVENGAASLLVNADVSGSAAISVSKLSAGTNITTFLATPSSANLAAALTDETGTGLAVFATSPLLTTPTIADSAGGQKYVFVVSNLAADRNITLPLLTGNDTFVFNDFIATLTNKTIASPTITGTPIYQGTRTTITPVFGEIQTASTSITTIASFTMADETEACFEIDMGFARRTNVTKAGRYKRAVTYRRTGGGAPTIVGSLESGTDQQTEANTITVDVSSNDVRFRATSADSDGRNWWVDGIVKVTTAV